MHSGPITGLSAWGNPPPLIIIIIIIIKIIIIIIIIIIINGAKGMKVVPGVYLPEGRKC
jgi:hypothetical protein